MASDERAFRTELVDAFRRTLAFVQVIQQRFAAGMPDLLVCYRGEVWFLELKYTGPRGIRQLAPIIQLSPLQRAWMRRYQNARGNVAWIVGEQSGPVEWWLNAGIDPDQQRVTELDLATTRRRGVSWDVDAIMSHLERREG